MTISDCREAIDLKDRLKMLECTKKANASRNYLSTQPVDTGRGCETTSFEVPWAHILITIDERINDITKRLADLGITD
jgi:hypothetical protein